MVDDLDELLLDDFSVELDVCFVVLIVVVVVSLCVDVEVDVEVAFFVEVDVLDDLKVDFTEDVDLTEDLEVDLLDAAELLVSSSTWSMTLKDYWFSYWMKFLCSYS